MIISLNKNKQTLEYQAFVIPRRSAVVTLGYTGRRVALFQNNSYKHIETQR